MAERGSRSVDLPLFRWGDALRTARARRRRLRRRATLLNLGLAALATTIALPPRPLLIWNPSASAPPGLYRVSSADTVDVGDRVVARVPQAVRALAARRHYVPVNVPLVKRVAAMAGDRVCALGQEIFVNGRLIAERRASDGAGRPMPWWRGCVTLRGRALFLLVADHPASFDGRYFGPTEPADVLGKATLLWSR
jgi:conjugative transfer signal peptidase TraF